MSSNIEQIYTTNPSTNMGGTDLMYKGISPYASGNDSAIQWSDLQNSITGVGTLTAGTWNAGIIPTQYGGTGASLSVPLTGGIVYFNSGVMAVTSNALTANQAFLSGGAGVSPVWSTCIYPNTTTVNQLLYSSTANHITGLTTANSSVLVTSSGGVPSLSNTLPAPLNYTGRTSAGFPASGNIGEVFSTYVQIGSAVPISNSTFAAIVTISLPAGNWQLSGNLVLYDSGSTANISFGYAYINNAITFGNQADAGYLNSVNLATSASQPTIPVTNMYVTTTTTTTYYLLAFVEFTLGASLAGYGKLIALRTA